MLVKMHRPGRQGRYSKLHARTGMLNLYETKVAPRPRHAMNLKNLRIWMTHSTVSERRQQQPVQGNFNIHFRLGVAMQSNFVKFKCRRSMSRSKNQFCPLPQRTSHTSKTSQRAIGFCKLKSTCLFPGREK